MKITPWLLGLSVLAACSPGNGGDGGGTTGTSSSSSSGGSGNGWKIVPLDTSDGGDASDLALAVGPNDTVGVAYYLSQPTPDGGTFQPYQIRYVQYPTTGQPTTPSVVDTVVHPQYGLGLAIQASGLPAVAYLGGAPYGPMANYWIQSQAVVSYQQAGGTWNLEVTNNAMGNPEVAQTADGGMTDYMVSGMEIVVGLFSQIGFDSKGTAYDFYRDINFAQSIGTTSDYGSSDIEGEVGGPTAWNLEWAFAGNTWVFDGTPPLGLGGHNQLVMANDQPAIVCNEFSQTAGDDTTGLNVDFVMRLGPNPANNWTVPLRIIGTGKNGTGPSIAWDSTFGYAVVVYDNDASKLLFTSSPDGVTWQGQDDVYAGAGGWFPSVAISPITHKPTIADFLCSNVPGPTSISQCPASQEAIEVRTFTGNSFATGAIVDPAGGYEPKIAYLSTGKMVIAYRQLPTYDIVLAVQQ
jgi:hypothetical protein